MMKYCLWICVASLAASIVATTLAGEVASPMSQEVRPIQLAVTGLDCDLIHCTSTAADPYTAGHRITASEAGLFASDDDGKTWALIPLAGVFDYVGFDRVNFKVVYAIGTDRQIFKSSDGGTAWASVALAPTKGVKDLAFKRTDPSYVLLIADSGIYRSTNGMTGWTQLQSSSSTAATSDLLLSGTNRNVRPIGSPYFEFGLKNNGPDAATNVRFTAPLPEKPTMVAAAYHFQNSGEVQCSMGSATAICEIPNLDTGQNVSIFVYLRVAEYVSPDTGFSASVQSDSVDPNSSDNAATSTIDMRFPVGSPPSNEGGGSINLWSLVLLGLLAASRALSSPATPREIPRCVLPTRRTP